MAKLKLETSTITRRQMALLALLAVALIGALYWPGDEAPADVADGDQASPTANGVGPRLPRRKPASAATVTQWPQVDLEVALRHDPFASPLLNASPATPPAAVGLVQQQEAELLALKQDGVNVILRDAGGVMATVGNRKLRVGDVIEGYRVVAIEMDGVILERVKAE